MGEANCRLAVVALLVGLLAAGAEDEPLVQVYPSNGGQLLCASECSTCPFVCSSPPPPPPPISQTPSLPSPPDFSYATPPMPLFQPPSPPPPSLPSPLSYIYPQTPPTFLPPASTDQSPMFPYPYYFFYHNSGAPAAAVASRGVHVLTTFSFAAILLVF